MSITFSSAEELAQYVCSQNKNNQDSIESLISDRDYYKERLESYIKSNEELILENTNAQEINDSLAKSFAELSVQKVRLEQSIDTEIRSVLSIMVKENPEGARRALRESFPDQKIEQIRIIRSLMGWNLIESKNWVEEGYPQKNVVETNSSALFAQDCMDEDSMIESTKQYNSW